MGTSLIYNIGTLLTLRHQTDGPLRGAEMSSYEVLQDAAIYMADGFIKSVGRSNDLRSTYAAADTLYDANGRLVTPGLVDAHTHLVHGGSREHELAQKTAGVPYLEILRNGGGILNTVHSTRDTSLPDLKAKASRSLHIMLAHGVTTVEAKSGYGLDLETEYKQLHAVMELHDEHPLKLISTFLGAHAIPPEYLGRGDAYIEEVIRMLPIIANEKLAEFCDIFCETGVFTVEQSRRLFQAALEVGLIPKIHADEIDSLGGTRLACEVGAASADHLLACTDEDMARLHDSGVIPVVLPGTSWNLGKPPARARTMIDTYQLPVAVASDYNPGSCPTENLQLVMAFATHLMKLSPLEVFAAVTRNAAHAVRRGKTAGTLDVGGPADIVLWQATNPEYVVYHFGVNHVDKVWVDGQVWVDGGVVIA
jgi:imidazolonepropionase